MRWEDALGGCDGRMRYEAAGGVIGRTDQVHLIGRRCQTHPDRRGAARRNGPCSHRQPTATVPG